MRMTKKAAWTTGIAVALLVIAATVLLSAVGVLGGPATREAVRPGLGDVSRRDVAADLAAGAGTSPAPSAAAPKVQAPVPAAALAPVTATASGQAGRLIVIDAGHQGRGDSSLEPVGPGASEKKAKVAGGATGVATGNPEGLVNLQVALKLRDELTRRGFSVVMVRTSQDVNIANSARAEIANDARAALFVRLHCDSNASSSLTGLSTLVPGTNRWTGPIVGESGRAGRAVHAATIAATGARDRGVVARDDLAGFNYSRVPTILIEMGFLSNPAEDRLLGSSAYQQKLATGMANGIGAYLSER